MATMKSMLVFAILALHKNFASLTPSDKVELRNLQKNMLDLFGLENRPRPEVFSSIGRDTSSAKRYMLKLYHYTQGETIDSVDDILINWKDEKFQNNGSSIVDDADTVVGFVNNAYVPRPNISDERGSMFFDVSSNLVIEKTLASELRIYLDVNKKTSKDNVFRVTIYQIVLPKTKYQVLTSRVINASKSDWHKFGVIEATKSWTRNSVTNNGVLIVCQNMNNKVLTLDQCGLVDFEGSKDFRPFLVSFYKAGGADEIIAEQIPKKHEIRATIIERFRRSLKKQKPSNNKFLANSNCAKHHLYVSFKYIGWSDWMLQPDGYNASYCYGKCEFPLGSSMNATNHATIQSLVHLISPEKIPAPCCAPVRLNPLKILFFDDRKNIVIRRYSNMKVANCGCQ